MTRFTGALDGATLAGDPRDGMKRGKSWPTELNGGTRKPDLVGVGRKAAKRHRG